MTLQTFQFHEVARSSVVQNPYISFNLPAHNQATIMESPWQSHNWNRWTACAKLSSIYFCALLVRSDAVPWLTLRSWTERAITAHIRLGRMKITLGTQVAFQRFQRFGQTTASLSCLKPLRSHNSNNILKRRVLGDDKRPPVASQFPVRDHRYARRHITVDQPQSVSILWITKGTSASLLLLTKRDILHWER